MKYSIRDEDIMPILTLQNNASDNINHIICEFSDNILEWEKKLNSGLACNICRKTLGMLGENYIEAMKNMASIYDEQESSFSNISKRFRVGDEALHKVKGIQSDILERLTTFSSIPSMDYICDGEAKYSNELITEYGQIVQSFLNKVEESLNEYYGEAIKISNENVFGVGILLLIKYQYETLEKICMSYNRIFDLFLEWYEKTLKENEILLEEINKQAVDNSTGMSDEHIENLISLIMKDDLDRNNSGNLIDTSAGKSGDKVKGDSNNQKIDESIKKSAVSAVESLTKELDSPEKIKMFKNYISACQKQLEDYNQEKDSSKKKTKFNKLCDFIKINAQKYCKPLMKALAIIIPILAPQGHIAAKVAEALPQVMECFSGLDNTEKDVDKIELGLDCMKSIGIDKLPETGDDLQQYIRNNSENIANDILKKVLSSEKYMIVLNIDSEELCRPENEKIYKAITGKDVKKVPMKRKAYNYDFEKYNPEALKNALPIENEDKAISISNSVEQAIQKKFNKGNLSGIYSDIDNIKSSLNKGNGSIKIPEDCEFKQLVDELRKYVNGQTQEEVLPNIDGAYNKYDIKTLCDELEYEKKKGNVGLPNISLACKNFMRRQMGYPAKNDVYTVKEIQELIPIINNKYESFEVMNDYLLKSINNAQNFAKGKNSNIKKKSILNSLAEYSVGCGAILGFGALITMGTLWPLGIALAITPLLAEISDDRAGAYTYLVYNLGEERTEYLLNNYRNIPENKFQIISNNI